MILKSSYAIKLYSDILCFVDRASLYILVNKINLVQNLFLVYLYLSISTCFGATMCPSSGDTTVFMRHLLLVILFHPKNVELDKYKYTKNKFSTKLVLFTRLYSDMLRWPPPIHYTVRIVGTVLR
jgi:hypothetical protein